MKVYSLKRQQLVPGPVREVFPFFSRPENLALLTPPSLRFRILSPEPVPMQAGALIDYTIRLLGIPVRWTTIISVYTPPSHFVDEQLKGPYACWHHTHTFQAVDGGTLITDQVRYALPLGVLGRIVHALWVKHSLDRIFRYRQKRVEAIFSASRQPDDSGRLQPVTGEVVV